MKSVALFVVIIWLAVGGYTGPHKKTQSENYHAASQNLYEASIASYSIRNFAANIRQKRGYQQTAEYLKRAFGPECLATWVLVLAAGIGIRYTIKTLGLLSISANAAKKAADAAWLNAQAVIHTERPWLILEQFETGPRIGTPNFVINNLPPTDEDKHTDCIFYPKNYGRTPAVVVAQKEELQMGNHGLRPPNPAFFGSTEPIIPYVFPQGISRPKLATLASNITQNTRTSIAARATFVWLCGYIRYKGSVPQEVGIEYETRFCYVYREIGEESTWSLGPAEYNSTSEHQYQKTN